MALFMRVVPDKGSFEHGDFAVRINCEECNMGMSYDAQQLLPCALGIDFGLDTLVDVSTCPCAPLVSNKAENSGCTAYQTSSQ